MIHEEFNRIFGEKGISVDCTCFYCDNHAYDFTFHIKGFEQIDTRKFSLIGDIVSIDDDTLPLYLKKTLIPKIKENIVLVYDIEKRAISFTSRKSGLTIYPIDNGIDAWQKILGIASKFISESLSVK